MIRAKGKGRACAALRSLSYTILRSKVCSAFQCLHYFTKCKDPQNTFRSRISVSHSSRDLSALLASHPPSLIRPPATGTNHLASGGHHVHRRTIPINISTSRPRRPFHAFPSFFRSSDEGILQPRTLPLILWLYPWR